MKLLNRRGLSVSRVTRSRGLGFVLARMFSASIHKSCEHVTPLLQDDRMAISAQSHTPIPRRPAGVWRERVVHPSKDKQKDFLIRPRTPTRSSLFHTLQHVYRAHITDLLRYILDRLRS